MIFTSGITRSASDLKPYHVNLFSFCFKLVLLQSINGLPEEPHCKQTFLCSTINTTDPIINLRELFGNIIISCGWIEPNRERSSGLIRLPFEISYLLQTHVRLHLILFVQFHSSETGVCIRH